jgi:predicted dehydrogenase
MAQIRYGQIGVGHAHASKMSVYRSSDDFDVVGVSESDPELRKRFTDHAAYRDLKWMTEEELLNAPGLQVVGVETKVRDLLPTAEKCVAAGKHVHIDKPAGESLPLFRSILDEAAKKHLAVQMGYMYRFNPAVLFMQDCLKKGWLGEPFEVHTVMSKVVAASSRKGLAEYPGGIMFELGCHILDVAMGVLGRPESVHPVRQHASKIDDTLVDNMLATLVYPKAIAPLSRARWKSKGFPDGTSSCVERKVRFTLSRLIDPTFASRFHRRAESTARVIRRSNLATTRVTWATLRIWRRSFAAKKTRSSVTTTTSPSRKRCSRRAKCRSRRTASCYMFVFESDAAPRTDSSAVLISASCVWSCE